MDDVRRVITGRVIRGFADGFVSVLLAQYLTDLGFSPLRVGAIITGTLLGSAALTLVFGLGAHRTTLGRLLVWACVLMAATGVGFAATTAFWPLLIVAIVGTLNPSAGDVSVFLPTEQAFMADRVEGHARTRLYAVYNLGGVFAGALGALASGLPDRIANATDWRLTSVERLGFVLYAAAAVAILVLYRSIPGREPRPAPADTAEATAPPPEKRPALGASRRIVLELAALFSLDSAGSGFVVTSLLVLWLHLRFDLSRGATAGVFFTAGLLGACSQLLAPVLAKRIGLIRTMVFTHLPANALLALAAFAPNGTVAVALLLVRALFAQMDVPARQAFVMSVVPAHERAAASSITNVPRSLASATTPLIAGALLSHSTFGWPLLIAGATKFSYDLLLLVMHRNTPEAEVVAVGVRSGP
ncbi:MAG: major facilitator superfamily 1 [Acidimicrobiales bacterium]|nr:major facilitator superfamily 1 [Acidimicrobiales bacterium]